MNAIRIAILGEIATALTNLKAPRSALDAHRLTASSTKDLHSALKRYGATPDLLAVVEQWHARTNDAKTLGALQAFNSTSHSRLGIADESKGP